MARYKYLGKKVRDVGMRGLDTLREFYGIARAIVRDYKAKRIKRKTAMGRLLLLYRLTFKKNNSKIKHLSTASLRRLRDYIKTLMQSI